MRRALDAFYRMAGALAGVFLIGIAALVVFQILTRLLGVFVRGIDQFICDFLAASLFLALAYTFGSGGHIRITLVVGRLGPRLRRLCEILTLGLGTAVAAYFAWHAIGMVWDSYRFGDLTTGMIAMPLWIPQISMAVGLVALALAFVDALIVALCGGRPSVFDRGDDYRG
ncbi:MAG: TRAP transporter small permease [Thermodesulfobacteriota bacterium]|nr:TRAP transporter small permease [Thermodesulfobacteriota bacterium]